MSAVLRWLATLAIAALLALSILLPHTPIGRRGSEAVARADVEGAVGEVGGRLPELALRTLERSVDW